MGGNNIVTEEEFKPAVPPTPIENTEPKFTFELKQPVKALGAPLASAGVYTEGTIVSRETSPEGNNYFVENVTPGQKLSWSVFEKDILPL